MLDCCVPLVAIVVGRWVLVVVVEDVGCCGERVVVGWCVSLVDVSVLVVDDAGSSGFSVVSGLLDDVGSLVVDVVEGRCVSLAEGVKDVDC